MTDPEVIARRTLAVAERVGAVLADHGVETAVIGAMAAAAHNFSRETRDFDLATFVDPFTRLREVARAVGDLGFRVELREPDASDPLGGVLDVRAAGLRAVQVVNFLNPLATSGTGLGAEAIREAEARIPGSPLRVVRLSHLIAMKLYSGGPKSRGDVVELLARNAPVDLAAIRDVCARHGLGGDLQRMLDEVGLA